MEEDSYFLFPTGTLKTKRTSLKKPGS